MNGKLKNLAAGAAIAGMLCLCTPTVFAQCNVPQQPSNAALLQSQAALTAQSQAAIQQPFVQQPTLQNTFVSFQPQPSYRMPMVSTGNAMAAVERLAQLAQSQGQSFTGSGGLSPLQAPQTQAPQKLSQPTFAPPVFATQPSAGTATATATAGVPAPQLQAVQLASAPPVAAVACRPCLLGRIGGRARTTTTTSVARTTVRTRG